MIWVKNHFKNYILLTVIIDYFGDDGELFFWNYQDACALVIIQIGEFMSRLSDDFNEHSEIPWTDIRNMGMYILITMIM